MNSWLALLEVGLAPLIMSASDMILLCYLCGGARDHIRKDRSWAAWFLTLLVFLVTSQLFFNGKTNPQAHFVIFYALHFLALLVFSAKCTRSPLSARFYLVILSVLANDICLILVIALSRSIFNFDYVDLGPFPTRAAAHAVLLALKIAVTVLIRRWTRKQIYGIETVYQAVIIVLPALPYFFLRDYAFLFEIDPLDVPLIIHYMNVLFGILALINMILGEQLSYRIRQNDVMRVENLVKKQHDQFLSSLKTIETVNQKYHDLHHIMNRIESMDSVPEIKCFIETLQTEIQDYELIFNTGNRTLDIILSERMQEAKERKTRLHVHADGQGWDAIRDIDITTIIGNALDNAFESTEKNEDVEKRLVDVRIGKMNHMLIARFENRFTHPLVRRSSRLISTKRNPQGHGYGLQSIEMAVKKYGGEMDIKTDNGLFTLTLIIPVSAN